MGKFLRVLQKAGLVEADADDASAALEAEALASVPSMPDAEPAAPATGILSEAESRIEESRSFDVLYAERGVPASPFPAEKLLKLVDGLRAMEPAVRKAAVLAMDSADDNWTIDDAALDASRKIKALNETKALLVQQAASQAAHAQERLQAREQRQSESLAAIRQQIGDLEALMQREVEKATAEKASLGAEAKSAHEASLRESARLDLEIARLQEVLDTFVPPAVVPSGTPASRS
ncbi:MAG: putative methyl-accepting chemotaxis sensory transducer [Panacagrimonas sp.]|jgi:hypothetical protein|nr:hypothetical protein [Panacagrimonas sp.]MCC2656528.1 putative methyl-accepting chemotaxis sensory transducer [Panacagrimonas sp.]